MLAPNGTVSTLTAKVSIADEAVLNSRLLKVCFQQVTHIQQKNFGQRVAVSNAFERSQFNSSCAPYGSRPTQHECLRPATKAISSTMLTAWISDCPEKVTN